MVGGENAMSYFRKLSGSTHDFLSSRVSVIHIRKKFKKQIFQSNTGQSMQVLAAYSYKDHFSASISIAKKIGSIAFCRYIGANGTEVAEPVESRVYPFFVVYCSRRNNVTMLGVTNDKSEPITAANSALLIRRKFKGWFR